MDAATPAHKPEEKEESEKDENQVSIVSCAVCRGGGRITIKIARILGWLPILHLKRQVRPKQISFTEVADGKAESSGKKEVEDR